MVSSVVPPGRFLPGRPSPFLAGRIPEGLNLLEMPEPELYARACEHGWGFACFRSL